MLPKIRATQPLRQRQGFVLEEPAERHRRHRAEKAELGDEVGIEPGDAPEPDDVGEGCADQAEIGNADQVIAREAGQRLEISDERWQQQDTARRQLPRREGEQRHRRLPAPRQHGAQGHG
jgi:hypothetical protein